MMRKRRIRNDKDQPNLKRIRAEVENFASVKNSEIETGGRGKSSGNAKHNRKDKRKEARKLKKVRKLAYSQRKPIPTQDDIHKVKREENVKKQKEEKLKRLDAVKKEKKKRKAKRQQQVHGPPATKMDLGTLAQNTDPNPPAPRASPEGVRWEKEDEVKQRRIQDTYDDREIRDLEKKLHLNKRKKDTLPQSFIDDGLDYIFDVIGGKLVEEDNNEESEESDEDIGMTLGSDDDDDDDEEASDNESEIPDSENTTKIENPEKPNNETSLKVKKTVKWKDDVEAMEITDGKKVGKKEHLSEKKFINVKKRLKEQPEIAVADDDKHSDDSDFSEAESVDDSDDDEEDVGESDHSADSDVESLGDDDDISEDELKKSGDSNPAYREDIYGRLRDEGGNVVTAADSGGGAYVPPGKRRLLEGVDGKKKVELERLKKQLKGFVNRTSESNIQPISSQIENLYLSNSRADVNDSLTELIFDACITATLTSERLAMEIMMLMAILHGNIGSEVGAMFLQSLVRKFDELSKLPSYGAGKYMDNVVVLLAHLYNFKVVHSVLLFDIMKKLVTSFEEKDIELILLVLRHVGFTLRKDDPTGLKALIVDIQSKATGAEASSLADQSRVKFMLDVIMAIRNNNMRKIPNYDPEHLEHLRKLIRNYIRGGQFGDNQLHISLEDLLQAGDKGRWWVVGSAWQGQGPKQPQKDQQTSPIKGVEISSRLQELARKQRMNTDLRRTIFFTLMTSEDYIDAFEKLLRQGLKSHQQQEIVVVILDCCLHEKTFNPFYAHLGQKFCEHHRSFQMAFQFTLWDRFKEMAQLTDVNRHNLGKLLTHLFATKALSLSVLKVVSFGTLEKPMVRLLKQVLGDILVDYPQSTTEAVFQRVASLDKLNTLHEGLKLFLHHFLLRGKILQQNPILKERVEVVNRILSSGKNKMLL